MKKWIKRMALTLSVALVVGNAAALAQSADKEEVVYTTLDKNGGVEGVYVVNVFPGGEICDYGDYSAVRMLNTEDEISYADQTARFTSTAQRVYYQGNMKNAQLPWLFEFSYELDGQRIEAEEMAGKSGHMRMRLRIQENPQAQGTFFQSHALQITAALNTDLCANIEAEGATQANVGNKRQLSYILLPGTEKEYVIEADVRDFEMDALSINGIHMCLDVEVTSDDFSDAIDEIRDAARDLDDGARELLDGARELDDGLKELRDHNEELMDGADQIVDAILETANDELEKKRADFEKLGIELRELTRENYNDEIIRLQQELLENVEDYVYREAERVLRRKVNSAARDEVISQVNSGAREQVEQAVTSAVEQQVRSQVVSVVEQQVRNQVCAQVEAMIRAEILAQMNPATAEPSADATVAPTTEPTTEVTAEPTAEPTTEPTAEPMTETTVAPAEAENTQVGEETIVAWLFGTAYAEGTDVDALVAERMNSAEVQARIDALTQSQLASDEIQSTINAQTRERMQTEQARALIEENIQAQLASGDYQATVEKTIEEQLESDEVKKLISSEISKQKKSKTFLNSVAEALEENGENGEAYRALADLQESLDAVMEFYDGLKEYTDGVAEAADGSGELLDGTDEMKDGTLEFRTKTLTIDARITSEADALIAERTGADVPLVSFVDARNGEIASVQFVISTPAIHIPEEEEAPAVELQEQSFADKLKDLFSGQN